MKKALLWLLIGLLIGAAAVYLLIKGFAFPTAVSGEKTSFAAVTEKLDAGGDFYLYLRTDTIVQSMEKLFGFAEEIMSNKAVTDKLPTGIPEFSKWKDTLWKIWEISGLKAIDGIGASSVTIEPRLYHSKFVIHHPAENGDGLIWSLSRKEPRPLDEIRRYFPADTALAVLTEFQMHDFWKRVKSESEKAGWKEVLTGMDKMEQELSAQGIDLNKILGGFEGRLGYLLNLDSKKVIPLPIPGQSITIPEPSLAIYFKVKDSVLFDLLEKKTPGVQKSDKGGIRMLKMSVLPMPFPLEPVLAQKDGLLVIASRPQLVEQMFDPKSAKLTGNEEYRKYARALPTRGTEFGWVSPAFCKAIGSVLQGVDIGTADAEARNLMLMLNTLFSKPMGSCQVGEHIADGAVWTSNSSFSLEDIIDFIKMGIQSGLKEKKVEPVIEKGIEQSEGTQDI